MTMGVGSRRGRPKLPPEQRKVTISMRIDPGIRKALEALAKQRGITMSSLIETAIDRELAGRWP